MVLGEGTGLSESIIEIRCFRYLFLDVRIRWGFVSREAGSSLGLELGLGFGYFDYKFRLYFIVLWLE